MLEDDDKKDLNLAILGYLNANGFPETYKALKAVLPNLTDNVSHKKLLADNWRAIPKLQIQISELEKEVEAKKKEIEGINNPDAVDTDPLPRSPAKFTLTGHKSCVTCVKFHPVFGQLATASEDSSIQIWNPESGQLDKTLTGHQDAVNCIAFAPKTYLASCSADMTIKLWDIDQSVCTKTMKGHEHNISALIFSAKGDSIISCSRDKTIKVWDTATGVCRKTYKGHSDWVRSVVLSPDRSILASCANDKSIKLWAMNSEECIATLEDHEHAVETICFSLPQTDNVIIKKLLKGDDQKIEKDKKAKWREENEGKGDPGGAFLLSGSRDRSIKLWSLTQGRVIRTIERAHDNWVRGLLFHPSGRYFLSCSDDKSIKVWDLADDCQCIRKIENAHSLFVSCIDMVSSMNFIASGGVDGVVKVWECK